MPTFILRRLLIGEKFHPVNAKTLQKVEMTRYKTKYAHKNQNPARTLLAMREKMTIQMYPLEVPLHHARTLCTAKREDYASQTQSTLTRILLDFIIHDYANVISFYFIN